MEARRPGGFGDLWIACADVICFLIKKFALLVCKANFFIASNILYLMCG